MKTKLFHLLRHFILQPPALLMAWISYLSLPFFSLLRFLIITRYNTHPIVTEYKLADLFLLGRLFIALYCGAVVYYWFREYSYQQMYRYAKLLVFIVASGVMFLFFNAGLLIIASSKYPNYLYAHFGLSSEYVQFFIFFTPLLLLPVILILLKKTSLLPQFPHEGKANRVQQIVSNGLVLIFLYMAGSSFYPLTSFVPSLKEANATYEQKLGREYELIKTIIQYVPEDQVVIHPPQSGTWPLIGNQPMIRYFLFPRTLVSGALITSAELPAQLHSAYFLSFSLGSEASQWPKIDTLNSSISFDTKNKVKFKSLHEVGNKDEDIVYRIVFYE